MERAALILGDTILYWDAVIVTLAAASAALVFLGLYLEKSGDGLAAGAAVPLAVGLSMVLGRFIHWYCLADSYGSFRAAFGSFTTGGYALAGAFFGCALAAGIVRLLRLSDSLPRMLDAMAPAGAWGICVGRLACFFSAADRGRVLEGIKTLPLAYPVTDGVTGAVEYRLATFLLQALSAGAVFLSLLALRHRRRDRRPGDLALWFLLLYGAGQIVLDSTRYDSLFFRSNGFVSMVQVLSAFAVVAPAVVFAARTVRAKGLRWWNIPLWLLQAALLACAGYMEYYVQRHAGAAGMAYGVMGACLAAFAWGVMRYKI